jgi:diguanylate cyclase (GGDEF)-like protein
MVNTVSSQIVTQDGENKPNTGDSERTDGSMENHDNAVSTTSETPDEIGTDKPDLGELTALGEQFNAAFNTALYELESSRKLIRDRAERIIELNESISALSNRLDEESRNSRRKDEEHAQEAEQLKQRLHAAESECERLQRQAGEQEAALQARIDEAGQLTQRIEELNSSLEEQMAKGQQAGEEFAREKDALAGNLAELQRKHEDTCEELDGFTRKVGELTAEIASLKQASELKDETYSKETARLGSELQERETELESLQASSKELAQHVEKLQGLNRALHESAITESNLFNKTLDDKAAEIESLRQRLESAGNIAESMQPAAEETEKLQTALRELESRLHEAEEQRNIFSEKAGVANELEAEVARLSTTLQEAGANGEQLQAALQEAGRLEAEVERLNTALQEASQPGDEGEQLQTAQEQVSRLESEVERLNGALQEAVNSGAQNAENTEQMQATQQQVAELEATLETTRAERDALDRKLDDHAALEQEVATLRQTLEQSDNRLREQEGNDVNTDVLTGEVERLTSALAAAEERCVQLQTALDEKADTDATPDEPADTATALPPEPVDELTDKATDREQFLMTLSKVLEEPRGGETKSTVMYLLMDNFIRIRDEIGIMNSERVMSEVLGIIKSNCGDDLITRFGDCTFAVLTNDTDIGTSREKAEKIRTSVESHIFDIAGQSLVTTTSIGICSVRNSDDDAEKVINRADLACESARTSGGNQVLVSSASLDALDIPDGNDGHAEIVSNVLNEGRIKIYYQPISSLKGNASHCYEVLTRIVDEDGNIILPGEFFSMAINSGMAMDVDLHVIENIMRMMAGNANQSMLLFLKLTRQTVASEDFAVWLMEKINHYKVDPEKLVFEVAENLVQSELKKLSMLSKALASIGCKLAVEHYRMETQPQHLQHIQANYLKIDSGLVQNINNKGKCFTKVTEIMEVARSNNFITIAEGVESPATLAILWELGVSLAQGYFIQSPVGNMEAADEDSNDDPEDNASNKATFTVM